MRRSDLNPPTSHGDGAAFDHPPLKGEGRTAAGSPGWGGSDAGDDCGATYAEAPPPPPGPLTRADLPPAGGGEKSLRQLLLSPRSVALIGQSNDPGKTAGRPLKFLRQAGYAGRIYPVNARRAEVLGERAWPSVEALPEVPEHAYVVAPIDAAMEAIEACGRAGVAVATVLTDGFAEVGEAGRARETRRPACASSGRRASASSIYATGA
jgi:predicted CoA-binding protein